MAPIDFHRDSTVVLKLIHRVRTKKRTLNVKNCQFRLKALLKSTEDKLLWDLEKLKRKVKGKQGNGEIASATENEGKTESGGNDDILSLNSFFEKLYKT